ncbi:MAG: hypothetical protein PHQ12_14105, partial [Chthoniobacteraceae bacterium]|nr:hypothetical protein [Chthoniobacteraceae bacterium]
HLKSQVVSLQAFAPDVSSPTAYVINRMQARKPEDRYASYDELLEHLEYARSELLGSAGKARQPKARLVVETEKQQNVFGYILMAGILFTAVMGGILYAYKDSIISSRSGVEDVARMRLERSLGNVDQTLTRVRKELVAGNAQTAIAAVQTLEGRADVPETSKVWVALHECAARLLNEEFWKTREITAQLPEKRAYKRENRTEEEQLRRFLTSLGALMRTRGKALDPAMNTWPKGTFEPLGFFLVGLKEWDAARFDSAAEYFQKFLAWEPKDNWVWIAEFKPLAQKARDDAAAFQNAKTLAAGADTPEKKAAAAKQIAALKTKLKLPGRLPEELAIYEANLKAAPEPSGRAGVAALLGRVQPAEAGRAANALRDASAQKALSQKAAAIGDLQKALIEDLNRFTANRWIARRSGPAIGGRVVQADETAIQIQPTTGGAPVSVPWTDVMPSSVLVWADSMVSATPELLWQGAVYASVAAYPREAQSRGARAAELRKEYAPLLPLLKVP